MNRNEIINQIIFLTDELDVIEEEINQQAKSLVEQAHRLIGTKKENNK